MHPLASAVAGPWRPHWPRGPIIQIGAICSSTFGQWLRLSASLPTTRVAAGATTGIAATFNTSIVSVLFAVELRFATVDARTVGAGDVRGSALIIAPICWPCLPTRVWRICSRPWTSRCAPRHGSRG
ncbi:chloride channel protein [Acidihalobacter yilgarnensis]|uniref:chloride channel protein n=1 Tax=Acidihalobacter yilgarnensis TaxID=2819280 RepID=UPI0018D27B30